MASHKEFDIVERRYESGTSTRWQYHANEANAYRALNCSNSTVIARLRPDSKNVTIGIAPVDLSVLHVNCGNPNGNVAVSISPGGQTIVLADDGIGPDRFAGDGEYSGTWLPTAGGTYTLVFPDGDLVTVTVDPDLKAGFPVKALHTAGSYLGGAALQTLVGNIDSSPDQEIIVTGLASGPLYAWKSDGSIVPGWPLSEITTASNPALGRLSDVPQALDVVSSQLDGSIIAHSGSGALLMSWSLHNGGATMLTTADVNGDGVDEVIFTDGSYIRIEQITGVPLPGWPISSGFGSSAMCSVAVADLDGDKIPEIIFACNGDLRVFHSNGVPVAGFPVQLGSNFLSTVVVGDVDGDGSPEIITVGFAGASLSPVVRVVIVSNDGIIKQDVTGPGVALSAGPPALADLDGDGIPEILVQTSDMLHVWRGNGTVLPGWPVPLLGRWDQSSPVVGDVDGDGWPDVVVVSRGKLLVFNHNGEIHPGFPKTFSQGDISTVTPAIADIDLDGHNEIIVTSDSWTGQEGEFYKVWVYDLGGPPHGAILWGQLLGGPKHQGYHAPTESRWLAVNKIGSGNGTVSSNLPGIDCGVACAKAYAMGTVVNLNAVPDAGSTFSGWSGACNGATSCIVRMDSDKAVTAVFSLPLGLNSYAPPNGELGVNYNAAFAPGGGLPPYSFAVTRGSLPPGLKLGSPVIVGTPTRGGTYKFTIQVTDQVGGSVSQKLQIKILKGLTISTKSLKTARLRRAYNARLTAKGGQAPYTWALVSGPLPDGLTFDSSTGLITGTPAAAGSADLNFQVSDALGGTSQRLLTLTVR